VADDKTPDEPQYRDPKTGKLIIYGEAVPALLRGDLVLTPEEKAQIPALNALFEEAPLKLAAEGGEVWNLWVKANHERWLVQENKGEQTYISLKPVEGHLLGDGYFQENGIDFSDGQEKDTKGIYQIENGNFSGFTFPCPVSFKNVSFSGDAWFNEARFSGGLYCQRAVFFAEARWQYSQFNTSADFSYSQFLAETTFENANFKAYANFDHVWFGKTAATPRPRHYEKWGLENKARYDVAAVTAASNTVPDFKSTLFTLAPNLGYTHVPYDPTWLRWYERLFADDGLQPAGQKVGDADAAAKYRSLGELANRGHHHLAERRFFRGELLCRRGHEAKKWPEITMINLFELFSGCGLKFWRPIGWWTGLAVFFGIFYQLASPRYDLYGRMQDLVSFTIANALPVVGIFQAGNSRAASILYGEGGLPFIVGLLAGAHNLASTIFLFFALLAVRNYFKLG